MRQGLKRWWHVPVVLAGLLLSCPPATAAPGVVVTPGNCVRNITAEDVIDGQPGNDLVSTYLMNGPTLAVIGTSQPWQVYVSRNDSLWHAPVWLKIRRTGDGVEDTILKPIAGGNAFVTIPSGESPAEPFFNGTGDRTGIPTEVQLGGISITVPPNIWYTTTLVFTVTE